MTDGLPVAKRLLSTAQSITDTNPIRIFVSHLRLLKAYKHILDHSPWNHVRLADFVMPYFLFVVGVSISLSQNAKKNDNTIPNENEEEDEEGLRSRRKLLFRHISIRTIRLFVLGIVLQGGISSGNMFQYDLQTIRIPGILQRIALCYFVTAISFEYLSTSTRLRHVPILLRILLPLIPIWSLYLILTYYVPIRLENSNEFCSSNHPDFSIPCNAARQIDEWFFHGRQHLYQSPVYVRSYECSTCSPAECSFDERPDYCKWPYDPEGILPSIAAIGSTILGIPCGNWLQQLRQITNVNSSGAASTNDYVYGRELEQQRQRSMVIHIQWIAYGVFLCVLGIFVNMPWNKNLYTLTYAMFMGGCSVLNLLLCYYWIDVWKSFGESGVRGNVSSFVGTGFRYLGMNAIFVFVFGASGVLEYLLKSIYWDEPHNNVVDLILQILQSVLRSEDAGLIGFTLLKLVFWMIICRYLYRRKTFLKI